MACRVEKVSRTGGLVAQLLAFSLATLVLAHRPYVGCSALGLLSPGPPGTDAACPLPVDDSASDRLLQELPWTHPPTCERSTDRTAKFCAYTNSRHGPRGWSIITTPETAADITGYLNEALNASGSEGQRDLPYKLVNIPGKGKGLVAARPIRQYEEILVDYATVLVDIAFTTSVPAFLGYRLLHAAVDRLSDPASVRDLDKSNGFAQDDVENVLRTNGFHTPLAGVPHLALYPTVSRINHACKPNAYTRFLSASLQVSVAAATEIQAGEEVTISYITLGQPSSERRQQLQRTWGFECRCKLCTAGAAAISASDARRRAIEDLRGRAAAAFRAGRPYEALRLTRQVLALLPSEGLLVPLLSEQYENMARVFYVLRDRDSAHRYALRSLEVLVEQGYIRRVEPEHLGLMWKRFEEEEGGRF